MARIRRALGQGLRALFRWVATNVGRLLFWFFVVALVFGGAMATVTYLLVRDAGGACQTSAFVVTAIGTLIVAIVAGVAMTVTRTLANWVSATNLGPMVSQAIFAQTLGVSDKRPQGKTELAKSLEGKTVGEVRESLAAAFADVFASRSLDRWLPASGRWLASRVVNTAGAMAARVAVDQLPGSPSDESPVDLLRLRNDLGEQIHDQAVSFVTLRAQLFALAVVVVSAIAIPVAVLGIREAFRATGGA